ncbi:MAG: aspartyl/asparaginyl beta-hydroxylase domain-containing protein [Bacteroidota bacterium]
MKTAFYDQLDLPLVRDLEAAAPAIREEFERLEIESMSQAWHERHIYSEGWSIFGFRWQGQDLSPAYQTCPVTAAILARHGAMIDTAGFSILQAGSIIYPHVGYTDEVLRLHLGVIVPTGDLALRVGDEVRQWEEGKCFVFDDTIEHEVWNRTPHKRVALLIDLKKSCLPLEASSLAATAQAISA